jgi:hypothetical protein
MSRAELITLTFLADLESVLYNSRLPNKYFLSDNFLNYELLIVTQQFEMAD